MGEKCTKVADEFLDLALEVRLNEKKAREKELKPKVMRTGIDILEQNIKDSEVVPKAVKRGMVKEIGNAKEELEELSSSEIEKEEIKEMWENVELDMKKIRQDVTVDGPYWVSDICQEE